jgi:hypothetical protein
MVWIEFDDEGHAPTFIPAVAGKRREIFNRKERIARKE